MFCLGVSCFGCPRCIAEGCGVCVCSASIFLFCLLIFGAQSTLRVVRVVDITAMVASFGDGSTTMWSVYWWLAGYAGMFWSVHDRKRQWVKMVFLPQSVVVTLWLHNVWAPIGMGSDGLGGYCCNVCRRFLLFNVWRGSLQCIFGFLFALVPWVGPCGWLFCLRKMPLGFGLGVTISFGGFCCFVYPCIVFILF